MDSGELSGLGRKAFDGGWLDTPEGRQMADGVAHVMYT
jgi:hypothetical protein